MAEEATESGTTQTSEAGTTLLTETPATGAEAPEVTAEGTADGTTEETKPTTDVEVKPEGAPEAYDLKVPEGMTLDSEMLDKYTPVFKELGLTNEAAQRLADIQIQAQQEALVAQHTNWVQAVKSDPEMGGRNFESTKENAQSAIARFASPKLKLFYEQTGLGSHPEEMRAWSKVGAAMAEPKIVQGLAGAPARDKTLAEKMYGSKATA